MSRKLFDRDLSKLRDALLRMGSKVEKQLRLAIESLENRDLELANKVTKADDIIDQMQTDIDEMCVNLIAMQQPLAGDLRDIFGTIKVSTDLERMADHAVDIAKITKKINNDQKFDYIVDLKIMQEITVAMIRDSLSAFIHKDTDKAYDVAKRDNEVDGVYKVIFQNILEAMPKDPENIGDYAQFLFVCKFLERIADRTTNICESTIYLVTGKVEDLNE